MNNGLIKNIAWLLHKNGGGPAYFIYFFGFSVYGIAEQYNIIIVGEVNTSVLGRYHLLYRVYSEDGELVKELSRYVNVVDTVAPTYVENTTTTYYAGFSYSIDDFINNYDSIIEMLKKLAEESKSERIERWKMTYTDSDFLNYYGNYETDDLWGYVFACSYQDYLLEQNYWFYTP